MSTPSFEVFDEIKHDDSFGEQFEELEDAWSHVGVQRPFPILQIGGRPVIRNIDPVYVLRREDPDWVLLGTWQCGEDVRELDAGFSHWLILRRDLAALRFDRVKTLVDMG